MFTFNSSFQFILVDTTITIFNQYNIKTGKSVPIIL